VGRVSKGGVTDGENGRRVRLTGCQPQRGLKLSMTPTSSKRFGNSHSPGLTVNTVMQKRMRRNIAMRKNRPRSPRSPIDRYQTPRRRVMGHRGNITIAIMMAKAPAA
jgi:hypothetical protein